MQADLSSLPPNLLKLMNSKAKHNSPESCRKGCEFKPQPTDIILAGPPKSGTTWVQQILHTLRSRGNMDFEEISQIIPLLEMAHDQGVDLEAPHEFTPRLFKTHFWYPDTAKGASKYVYVIRKPADAAVSYYHFLANWIFSPAECPIDAFVMMMFIFFNEPSSCLEYGSHFHHLASWYPHRNDENVLWLHFEDLKQDLPECVRLISEFLEIGADDQELKDLAIHQASFDFMKAHAARYEPKTIRKVRAADTGEVKVDTTRSTEGKIRKGSVGDSKSELSAETLAQLDAKWKAVVTPVSGYETYEEMRAGINKELGRKFSS